MSRIERSTIPNPDPRRSPAIPPHETVILLVESDDDARDLLCKVLELAGHRVIVALELTQALVMLRGSTTPAMVLLDLRMPTREGSAFARALRSRQDMPKIPIVVLCADASAFENASTWAEGILLKPFGIDELLESLERFVGEPVRAW